MASFVFGGIYKCAQNPLRSGLCKVSRYENMQQVAFLSRAVDRVNRPPRPAPFPYLTEKYTSLRAMFDPVLERYDDNSKLIVVEGPPAAGKTEFAAHIAKEFDMLHVAPDPTAVYTDVTGRDLRYYTKCLPEAVQMLGLEDVLANPRHINVPCFQFGTYHVKFMEYVRALMHVLLTGQGVVMESCVYSHFIYMDAMVKNKYIRRKVMELYDFIQERSHPTIIMPHLVMYLDLPVDEVQRRIAKRNLPYEMKSELVSKKFLMDVDDGYKRFLKYISPHSYLLNVDVTKKPNMEEICEQLESLELDSFAATDTKMRDWIWETEQDLKMYIQTVTKLQERYPIDILPPTAYGISEMQFDPFSDFLLQSVRQEKDPNQILKPGYKDKVHEDMEKLRIFWYPVSGTYDPFDLVQRAEKYKQLPLPK